MTNIAIKEAIPFCFSDIINDLNLIEFGFLERGMLIPGLEDKNVVPLYYQKNGVLLVYHILGGITYSIE